MTKRSGCLEVQTFLQEVMSGLWTNQSSRNSNQSEREGERGKVASNEINIKKLPSEIWNVFTWMKYK